MKTVINLYDKITEFDNIVHAYYKAMKHKRYKQDVTHFRFNQERELISIYKNLLNKSYTPGPYKVFTILDPKERMISAAPFRDRVVHHALCNIIEPIFEKTFIFDSYANRKGKGTHAAIKRYHDYALKFPYVLKADIKKFFPSIDHEILKAEIRRKIACKDTLDLIDSIIDASNPQEDHAIYFPGDDLFTPSTLRRGIPIGNLTSQFWANVYLNRFDHYIKETLRVPGYIRYVDDFVLFAQDKSTLNKLKEEISLYLQRLRLLLHPKKTHIYRVKDGVPFLGFQVFPYYRYVQKKKTKRFFRHLRNKIQLRLEDKLSPQTLETGLNSWLGHIRFGQNNRLENRVFYYIRDRWVNLCVHPRSSWRVLEQQHYKSPPVQSQQQQPDQPQQQ